MKVYEDSIACVACFLCVLAWPHGFCKKGLPAPVVGAMVENASLFLSYSQLQHAIRWVIAQPPSQDLSLPQLALAGAGAGIATSFVLCVHHRLDSEKISHRRKIVELQ